MLTARADRKQGAYAGPDVSFTACVTCACWATFARFLYHMKKRSDSERAQTQIWMKPATVPQHAHATQKQCKSDM